MIYHVELAGGGWLSHDREGRIVAVELPGIGAGSFELLRDVLAEADAKLERRRREIADDDPEDSGDET